MLNLERLHTRFAICRHQIPRLLITEP